MATGTTTQYGSGTGIAQLYRDNFISGVFKNNSLLSLQVNGRPVFPELPVGDTSYRWKMQTSANTSVAVFTEGASAPTPVAAGYANLAVAYTYLWGWIRISGHVRDAVRNASPAGLNVVANEFLSTRDDLRDLMNTGLMSTSNAGLLVAIDSTTTYAGQARGSATWFEATETNHNGALTRAGLLNIHETCRDNDKAGVTSVILCPENQATNYLQLTGEPNAQNSSIVAEVGMFGGRGMDLAPDPRRLSFMGIPIVPLPDFDNDTFAGLDLRMTPVGPSWGLSIRRPFEMRGPDMSGDDDVYEISTAVALICHNPKTQWKLIGVTA